MVNTAIIIHFLCIQQSTKLKINVCPRVDKLLNLLKCWFEFLYKGTAKGQYFYVEAVFLLTKEQVHHVISNIQRTTKFY